MQKLGILLWVILNVISCSENKSVNNRHSSELEKVQQQIEKIDRRSRLIEENKEHVSFIFKKLGYFKGFSDVTIPKDSSVHLKVEEYIKITDQ